jgi:hypothetical protein
MKQNQNKMKQNVFLNKIQNKIQNKMIMKKQIFLY